MILRTDITAAIARDSLFSQTCLRCGNFKLDRRSFCPRCYFRLPKTLRLALWRPIGQGYEEALVEALNYLKADHLHLPEIEKKA